jgi:hypothetical protein
VVTNSDLREVGSIPEQLDPKRIEELRSQLSAIDKMRGGATERIVGSETNIDNINKALKTLEELATNAREKINDTLKTAGDSKQFEGLLFDMGKPPKPLTEEEMTKFAFGFTTNDLVDSYLNAKTKAVDIGKGIGKESFSAEKGALNDLSKLQKDYLQLTDVKSQTTLEKLAEQKKQLLSMVPSIETYYKTWQVSGGYLSATSEILDGTSKSIEELGMATKKHGAEESQEFARKLTNSLKRVDSIEELKQLQAEADKFFGENKLKISVVLDPKFAPSGLADIGSQIAAFASNATNYFSNTVATTIAALTQKETKKVNDRGMKELKEQGKFVQEYLNNKGRWGTEPYKMELEELAESAKLLEKISEPKDREAFVTQKTIDILSKANSLVQELYSNRKYAGMTEIEIDTSQLKEALNMLKPFLDGDTFNKISSKENADLYEKYFGYKAEIAEKQGEIVAGILSNESEIERQNIEIRKQNQINYYNQLGTLADHWLEINKQYETEITENIMNQARERVEAYNDFYKDFHKQQFTTEFNKGEHKEEQLELAQKMYDLEFRRQELLSKLDITDWENYEKEKLEISQYYAEEYKLIQEGIGDTVTEQWKTTVEELTDTLMDFIENGEWSWKKFSLFAVDQLMAIGKAYYEQMALQKTYDAVNSKSGGAFAGLLKGNQFGSQQMQIASAQIGQLTNTSSQTTMATIASSVMTATTFQTATITNATFFGAIVNGGAGGDAGGAGDIITSGLAGLFGGGLALASGGWVNEPVAGIGLNSGQSYAFGENESELVLPKSKIDFANDVEQRAADGGGSGKRSIENINMSINAIDSKSFDDYTRRNSGVLTKRLIEAIERGDGGTLGAIRSIRKRR